jgi:hypothetical protein
MTGEELESIARREWGAQGECASCGWHASIEEYDLTRLSVSNGRIELPCLSKDDDERWNHRGVRIYAEEFKSCA